MNVIVGFGIIRDEPNVTEDFIGVYADMEAWKEAKKSFGCSYDGFRSETVGVEGMKPETQRYNPNNPDTDW